MSQPEILVLYYSRYGATKDLARLIAEGIESVSGVNTRLRSVPPVSTVCEALKLPLPRKRCALRRVFRLTGVHRSCNGFPNPIWEYGCTNEIFL